MIVFFCSTPYQILTAINIKNNLIDNDADIYILNHFQKSQELVERLKEIKLFNKVEIVDGVSFRNLFSEKKYLRLYQKAKAYLFFDKLAKQYFQFDGKVYDEVYLTYPDVIIQLGIRKLYDLNSNIKIYLYEDGTGGYSSKILKISIYKKIFNKILGLGNIIDRYDNILVFKPELYSGNTHIPISKIPDIDIDNLQNKKNLNFFFDYKNDYKIDNKIIFLEQPFESEILNEEIKVIANEMSTFTKDYIVKLHPRSSHNSYRDFNLYQNNTVPWEIICLNNDIEKKVLISYYSTACFSSKILFDKEPTIVLLYNLKELPEMNNIVTEDTLKFVNKFKSTYRDQTKIFIPGNLEELKTYLIKVQDL